MTEPRVAVVVLAWNAGAFLDACLRAVLSQDYASFDVVVVDNASSDDSVAIARRYAPPVRIIQSERNLGYAGGNNLGIHMSDAEIIVLLNPDTVVQAGWLTAVVGTFQDSRIGIVGCKALYPEGLRIQHAGGVFEQDAAYARHIGWGELDHGQYDQLSDCEYVTGAAMGIHRRVLDVIGALDAEFFPAFFEEGDYCYRARRAGFRVVYQPKAVLHHRESVSIAAEGHVRPAAYHRNRVRFVLRHWDIDQLRAFIARERSDIDQTLKREDLNARARAYFDNVLQLQTILSQRRQDATLGGPLTPPQSEWLYRSLRGLRWRILQHICAPAASEGDDTQWPNPSANAAQENELLESMDIIDPRASIESLEKHQVLQEPQMRSKVPVLGRAIDWFRRAAVSAVLRHYVVPMIRQQSAFNAQVVRTLRRMEQVQQIMIVDEAVLLDHIEKLSAHRYVDDAERSAGGLVTRDRNTDQKAGQPDDA